MSTLDDHYQQVRVRLAEREVAEANGPWPDRNLIILLGDARHVIEALMNERKQ